jgi:hypothetical protein
MLFWDRYEFDKKHVGTRYAKLVFLHPVGSAVHIVHSGASGARNGNTLFFMLGWDQCELEEKRAGTPCAELVFWHQLGFEGHVVHNGVMGARNVDAQFFMLGWLVRFPKKHVGTHYAILCFCIRWNLRVT